MSAGGADVDDEADVDHEANVDDKAGVDDEGRDGVVFTLGSSRKVRLRDSETELTRLWEAAGDEARARGSGGIMRLRELNLVIYATGEDTADLVSSVIPRLAQRHPARAIVLLELPEAAPGLATGAGPAAEVTPAASIAGATPSGHPTPEPALDAWVTAACYRTHDGGRHVCWEQVTVPARGEAVRLLHAAAMSLLVPDLPTVFWWPGEPDFESHAFRRLGEVSDVVIIDSAGFRDPISGLGLVARVAYDGSRNFGLADLNWSRLTPWRDMTAEFFDDPVRLAWLPRIRRVEVSFGAEDPGSGKDYHAGSPAGRALLFVGWLAARLGWAAAGEWEQTGDSLGVRLRPRTPGGTADVSGETPDVQVALRRGQDPCGPLGGLVSVTLEIQPEVKDAPSALLSVVHSPDGCVCAVRVSEGDSDVLIRTFDVTPLPVDQLLADELDYPGPDPVFEESLLAAASLAALKGSDWFRP
jgi:glucose-6-phosphate dehydrogenase assembly protein OpcA